MDKLDGFFPRHAFKIIVLVIFLLPIWGRGAKQAMLHTDNEVKDWLPKTYQETKEFGWFVERFENETFVLVSWEDCKLGSDQLELFAQKLVKNPTGYYQSVETGTRLVDRLTSPPLNLSEEDAVGRLKKLFVGPDGEQTCAVVTLTDAGKVKPNKTLDELHRVLTAEVGVPAEEIRMGGPPVDNVEIGREGLRTQMWLIPPAGIIGISLAFWCLRSIRLTTMVFCLALYAAMLSLAVVWYTGGQMNAVLLTMPAVVYVAAISGAIHFSNYYRDSVAEGGIEGAPARALRHAWLPCFLSAATTSAGLLSLYTSDLAPIKSFGLYSAIGVVVTLVLLFVYLPSWMQLWPMKRDSVLDGSAPKAEDVSLPRAARRILEGVLGYRRWVFASLLLLMGICAFGLSRVETSIKLTKFFSPGAKIIQDYTWLEENLGPLVPMEVVVRINNKDCPLNYLERMQLIDRIENEMRKINDIGNTMSAVTFAPELEVKRRGILGNKFVVASTLNKRLKEHLPEYVEGGFLAIDGDEELWRISARVDALSDVDYGVFKNDIAAVVDKVLEDQRQQIAKQEAKKADAENAGQIADAPKPEAEQVAAAGAVHQGESATGDNQGITAVYTGLVPVVYKAQREMLNGLVENFIIDLATIAAVMTIVFMDLSAALIILIPAMFPVVCIFGIMGYWDIVVDVGTVMTPTVALGVSVDDVVHYLIWYRKGLAEGRTRVQSVMLAYEGCARAMYQSWIVLGLGLSVFALSGFIPTQRFGAMMVTLLTASLIGNLLLLPAVLCSPLGWFFGRRLMKKAKREGKTPFTPIPAEELPPPPQPQAHATTASTPSQVRRDPSHRSVKT